MKAPPNTTKRLKKEAEKLTDAIFRGKYCIVHFIDSRRFVTYNIEKHHLIKEGQSTRFKFVLMNILPVCKNKHRFDKDSAHEAEEKFLAWVKENLPLHWAWFEQHRYEKTRHISPGDWQDICDELRHYLNNPEEAERIIYEKV